MAFKRITTGEVIDVNDGRFVTAQHVPQTTTGSDRLAGWNERDGSYRGKNITLKRTAPQKATKQEMEKELAALRKAYTPAVAAFGGMTDEDKEKRNRISYLQNQLRKMDGDTYYEGVLDRMSKLDDETVSYLDKLNAGKPQDTFEMQGVADNRSWEERYAEEQAWESSIVQLLANKGYTAEQVAQMRDDRTRQVNRETFEAEVAKSTEEAKENGFKASLKSVPQNLTGGLGALSLVAQNAHRALTGDNTPVDYYTPEMIGQAKAQAARQTVSQRLEENTEFSTGLTGNVASFLYNTGMSMADSAAVALLGGWVGGAAAGGATGVNGLAGEAARQIGTKFGAGVGSALLGGAAATQAAREAKERGVSDAQALFTGLAAGAAEMIFEEVSLERLLTTKPAQGTLWKRFFGTLKNIGIQGFVEGSEETATTIANTLTDAIINGDASAYKQSVHRYMYETPGMTYKEADRAATKDWIVSVVQDFLGGMISGGVMGGLQTGGQTALQNAQAKQVYGEDAGALVGEALEIAPEDAFAQRMQGRLDEGKKLSGGQLSRLVQQNEAAMQAQDMAAIRSAAANRLRELGETEDADLIGAALAKQAAGQKLSRAERQAISESRHGQAVAGEMDAENIRTGKSSAKWAQQIGTQRINAEEYGRMLQTAQTARETENAEATQAVTEEQNEPQAAKIAAVEAPVTSFVAQKETGRQAAENQRKDVAADTEDQARFAYKLGEVDVSAIDKAGEIGSQNLAANDAVYQAAVEKYGEDGAFAVAAAYRVGNKKLNVSEFMTAFDTAYEFGVKGDSLQDALAAKGDLLPRQIKAAWSLGNDARISAVEIRKINRQGTGTFINESTVNATESQQALNDVYRLFAKRTGIDVKVVDELMAGNQAANASLVRDMMTIVISRSAKNEVQSFGHELGELAEAGSPEDMDFLRTEILRYWAKTQSATSVDDLIKAYQGTYQKAKGSKTYEQAQTEAVNDALGAILATNEGVDELMTWLQSDSNLNAEEQKTFLQKLADLFQKIVDGLKKLLENDGMTPMQQDMVQMEIDQKRDILKRLFAAVDKAALAIKESGEYYADITLAEAGIDDAFMAQLLESEVERKKNYEFLEAVYEAIDEKFGDAAYSISPTLMDDLAAVRDGTFKAKNNEVYVGESSAFLVNTINADPLSVTMPPRKAYSAMVSEATAKAENRWEHDLDYHDLGEQGLYDALVASENPVAAFASQPDEKGNKRSNRIVLVTDYVHNGKAVAVVEEMDTRGVLGGQLKKVNKTITAFDREWLFGDIEKAAADGRLLAYDKKRSQSLATRLGKTLRSDLRNVDFDANIRLFWENVKWAKSQKSSYTANPPEKPKTALAAAFEKAKSTKDNDGDATFSLPVNGESMTASTNREILESIADQAENADLTPGELDALRIFKTRLNKVRELQQKRAELGSLWHDQQFGGESEKAVKTMNRIKTMDGQLDAAEKELVKAESTGTLRGIVDRAYKAGAKNQRIYSAKTMQRYKERRDNADAVKKYRKRVQDKTMKLTEMLLRNSDKQHIPEQLKMAVGEFLTSIDFTSKRQLHGGEATKGDLRYTDTLNKLRRVLQNQVNYMEDPEKNEGLGVYLDMPDGFVQAIDEHIEAVQKTIRNTDIATGTVSVMTADELKDLDFFLTVLTSSINKVNAFIANGRYQHVSEAAMDAIIYLSEMKEFGGKHTKVDRFLNWDNTTPLYAFKRFGTAGSAIFEGLQDGWDKLAINSKQVIDFADKAYTEKEVKEWSEKIHGIELDGRTAQMTTAQIMSLYCLVKRKQAQGHLFGGGMRIGNIEIKAKAENGKVKGKQDLQQAEAFHLTMEDVARIISLLTDRQIAVADALQKYMNTVGSKWGNEVSFSRFGYNSFTEENYFPIESDKNNLPAIDPEARANDLFRLLNMCFTKGLTPKANNALVVNNIFDVFAAHMSDMAKYNALALPVLDAMKFYNFKDSTKHESGKLTTATVQKAIERAYGGAAKGYFIQFMKDMNGVHDGGRTTSESFAMKMVGNYKVAAVGANLRVALLQPTSYVRASAVIDPKYLTKALTMKPATKEMLENSGIAVWKSLGFYDTNIGRAVRDQIKGEATIRDKVVEKSMAAAELGDKLTWGALWNACKLECAAKGDKSMEAVAKRFREVVYATQVVDSTMTRSQTMRSSSSLTKMLTSFMSEPTLAYNMLVESYNTFNTLKRKGDKNAWQKCCQPIARSMMAYVASMTAAALAESLFDSLRDDDDYETFLEKFWEAFWGDKSGYDGKPVAGNLAADLNTLNKLPIIKDIVSEITGYENTRMDTQWFSSIIDAFDAWKSDTRPLYGKIYKTMQALSRLTGLPASNLMREVVTIYNNTIGVITGDKLKTYEPSVRTSIKEALDGGHLTEDEAMQELVDKGEADDLNDAYFIVKKWMTGDSSNYQGVYDAMMEGESITAAVKDLTDHGYEKDDVMSSIKSQIGKWYKAGEITKQQATQMLTRYFDMDSADIAATVNKWSSKVVTGIEYDDIGEEYLAGNITAQRAKQMFQLYGGLDEEKADEKITVLEFRKKHPGYDDITYAAVESYRTYGERAGVPVETFYNAWKYNAETDADVDANGNSISGSKKAKVLEYINRLNLTARQKDSLYYAFGWAESKIYEAPWH